MGAVVRGTLRCMSLTPVLVRTSREVGSCDLGDHQVQSLWAGSSGASLSPRAVGRQNFFLLRTGQIHLSRSSLVRLTFPQRINLPNLKYTHLNINLTKDIFTEASRISEPILSRCPGPATMTHSVSNHNALSTEHGRWLKE